MRSPIAALAPVRGPREFALPGTLRGQRVDRNAIPQIWRRNGSSAQHSFAAKEKQRQHCRGASSWNDTSLAFSTRLADLELDQSFSAVGSCYENSAVESFFATLKPGSTTTEMIALHAALFDDIEGFYNTRRIQRRLDHQGPIDLENHAAA